MEFDSPGKIALLAVTPDALGPNYAPQACGLLRRFSTRLLCSARPVSKMLSARNFVRTNAILAR
jgi:hypothetical protein